MACKALVNGYDSVCHAKNARFNSGSQFAQPACLTGLHKAAAVKILHPHSRGGTTSTESGAYQSDGRRKQGRTD
ncbi:hypothetical protein ARGLB_064_00980 [Arthrobacter globiformis NBRC 12137]|uniref:Uncharacterized protein n=1 Tax=Arthrobacter globiformis (strain ATCC 8010 / DSM 20124 / JCM 1332 / NBRC 12137 / NCIMB 8907 / NRRL B-2979 / 168) TaxID=1077972 RepID=H0QND4_ARTG1|nr:hypothetical protein ARGLB_064_00980 [Arthrobacter globiformis NBRC 12137]